MDDLRTKLDTLPGEQVEFVYARSKSHTTTEALRQCGIGRTKFYGWPNRDELEALASELRRNRVLMAEPKLAEAAEDAVDELLKLMRGARSEYVRLNAALAVLDRTLGPVTSRVDLTTAGEPIREGLAGKSDDELLRLLEDGDE